MDGSRIIDDYYIHHDGCRYPGFNQQYLVRGERVFLFPGQIFPDILFALCWCLDVGDWF